MPPGALKRCQVRKRGNCCKANTKPFLSGAVKPPRPRRRFSSGAEPCSIPVLLAKGTAEHGDANALPKPLPGDSRGMAAVPWGSPSKEKPRWEQRRPRGRASSHRVPAEGLDLALAVPVPLPSLHPRDKPHPSPALPQGLLPPFPTTQCLPAVLHCLAGAGGRLGKGFFPSAPARWDQIQPGLIPSPAAGSSPERDGPRAEAPAPHSVFTDSQNSTRNKL